MRAALPYVAVTLVTLAGAEAAIEALLRWPALAAAMPDPLRRGLEALYDRRDRRVVSLSPECARYDAELFYTLRPEGCRFRNREFDIRIRANRLGLRDDADALDRPEVIVLGDSHAMGWGVEEDQSFPGVLERRLGRKVLNAAVSSYGTTRELAMLGRLDRSNLKALVVQYAGNDYAENRAFLERGNLPGRPEAEYRRLSEKHIRKSGYFPMKHVFYIVREAIADLRARPAGFTAEDEIDAFLPLLEAMAELAPGVPIVVIDLNGRRGARSAFVDALERWLEVDPLGARVLALDLQSNLGSASFFVIDEHMNARGHAMVADRLAAALAGLRR